MRIALRTTQFIESTDTIRSSIVCTVYPVQLISEGMSSMGSTFESATLNPTMRNPALKEFDAKISELTKTTVDGRNYILVEKLRAWMRAYTSSPHDADHYTTNTERLFRAVYSAAHSEQQFLPFEASRIYEKGDKCSLVVFSILLDLELGEWIHEFTKKDILDRKLPLDLHSLERKLSGKGGRQVAERFNKRQWTFCPAIFSLGMEEEYVENQIIPICRRSKINTGGTARVDQITVQAEFVDQKLKDKLQNDQDASYLDKEHGQVRMLQSDLFLSCSYRSVDSVLSLP